MKEETKSLVIVSLLIIICLCVIFAFRNNLEDKQEYSGPVLEIHDKEVFRNTGKTIELEYVREFKDWKQEFNVSTYKTLFECLSTNNTFKKLYCNLKYDEYFSSSRILLSE